MEKDLQLLKEDSHYYGKFGRQFLSNSDIITLLNDPKNFRKDKAMTKAMLVGRYFHTAMLEPEKIDSVEYWTIDSASRNTKIYKEKLLHYKRPLMMLTKEIGLPKIVKNLEGKYNIKAVVKKELSNYTK